MLCCDRHFNHANLFQRTDALSFSPPSLFFFGFHEYLLPTHHMTYIYPYNNTDVLFFLPWRGLSAALFFTGSPRARGLVYCRNKILRRSARARARIIWHTLWPWLCPVVWEARQWAKHIPLRRKCLSTRRGCTYNLSRLPRSHAHRPSCVSVSSS